MKMLVNAWLVITRIVVVKVGVVRRIMRQVHQAVFLITRIFVMSIMGSVN